MPSISVVSLIAGESKEGLSNSLTCVENSIEELSNEGVPSQNIVVIGISQRGVLTIYTALYTKYKIGAFIPIVGWLPLRKVEPIFKLPMLVNKEPQILQVQGKLDICVSYIATTKTKKTFLILNSFIFV